MPLCRHKKPAPCPWCFSQDYSWGGEKIAPGRQLVRVTIAGRWYTLEEGGPDVGNTGLYLWPCSVALAELIAAYDLEGLSLLELGPGLGLPGMVAAAKGARVTFAENDKMVAARLGDNLKRNGLAGEIYPGDWRKLPGQFDCVVGSEITFTKQLVRAVGDVFFRKWTKKGPAMLTEADREPRFIASEMPHRGVDITYHSCESKLGDGNVFYYYRWKPTDCPPARVITGRDARNLATMKSILDSIRTADASSSPPDPVS